MIATQMRNFTTAKPRMNRAITISKTSRSRGTGRSLFGWRGSDVQPVLPGRFNP
jgi:hypothetical protein